MQLELHVDSSVSGTCVGVSVYACVSVCMHVVWRYVGIVGDPSSEIFFSYSYRSGYSRSARLIRCLRSSRIPLESQRSHCNTPCLSPHHQQFSITQSRSVLQPSLPNPVSGMLLLVKLEGFSEPNHIPSTNPFQCNPRDAKTFQANPVFGNPPALIVRNIPNVPNQSGQ
jgi:hypothetical protein